MKESILHYIWQNKLFNRHALATSDNEAVEIIDVGKLNTDAGPDFFNAKIRIGETIWAGNIEIHTLSSDWNKHNHQNDNAYDSVILHVVKKVDCDIFREDNEKIPQLELTFPDYIESNYENLIKEQKWVACSDKISDITPIFIQSWKNVLLTERLEQKMQSIEILLHESNQHWEEAFYITLARSFGFGTNNHAFEMLAKSISLSILGKHKNSLFQLEALLFGQSGLLNSELKVEYELSLQKEYEFLKAKFSLQAMKASQWKLLRLRPDNFPHIRIAQFAALIHSSTKLFSRIIEHPDYDYLLEIFKCKPSEFWNKHYLFGHESKSSTKKLGVLSIYSLLINTVIPFLFCYAHHKGNQELKDKAIQLLEQIPAEKNAITKNWIDLGMNINSAYDSQAFLQLKKNYCDDKKCLRCRIGHKVMTIHN